MGLPIVDAHLHLWTPRELPFTWMTGNRAVLNRAFEAPDWHAVRSAAGVSTAILVEAGQPAQTTDSLLHLADSAGIGAVVVPLVRRGARLPAASREPDRVRALRFPSFLSRSDWPANGVDAVLDRTVDRRLPVEFLVTGDHLAGLSRSALRHPDRIFIVDHLAKPPMGNGSLRASTWAAGIRALAPVGNVVLKVSGLVHRSLRPDGRDLVDAVTLALGELGPERLMLGSDWPVCTITASYQQTIDTYLSALRGLSSRETAAVAHATASSTYLLTPLR